MDRALRDALLLLHPTIAATRSWHSYRIRLASKLRAAVDDAGAPRYPDAVIQALLRWRSPASLQVYARYDTATYASILNSVANLDIASVQYSNLPELSDFDRLDALASAAPRQSHPPPQSSPPTQEALALQPTQSALRVPEVNVPIHSSPARNPPPANQASNPAAAALLLTVDAAPAVPQGSVQLTPPAGSPPPPASALATGTTKQKPPKGVIKKKPPFSSTTRSRAIARKKAQAARAQLASAAPAPHPPPQSQPLSDPTLYANPESSLGSSSNTSSSEDPPSPLPYHLRPAIHRPPPTPRDTAPKKKRKQQLRQSDLLPSNTSLSPPSLPPVVSDTSIAEANPHPSSPKDVPPIPPPGPAQLPSPPPPDHLPLTTASTNEPNPPSSPPPSPLPSPQGPLPHSQPPLLLPQPLSSALPSQSNDL